MDFRRLVDPSDGFSGEDAGFDKFSEADGGDGEAAVANGDAQEQIGDHGCDDLETNGVFAAAKEFSQAQMLLEPAEQQFDLPTGFVEGGDLDRRALEIIGDKRQGAAIVALEPDAAHRDRQLGTSPSGQRNLGVIEDFERRIQLPSA